MALIVLGALIGPPIQDWWERLTSTPNVGQQLDDVRREQARASRYVWVQRKVFLHGSGRTSWVFLSRSEVPQDSFEQQGAISPPKGSSDELRVYDVEDGELELRFRLQPQLRLRRDDGHSVPLGPAFEISLGPIRDRNHDGRPEIVGTIDRSLFDRRPRPEEGRVPFAVLWDDAQGRYRLRALVPKASGLEADPRPRALPPWMGVTS